MVQYGNVNDVSGYTEAFYQSYKAGMQEVLQETIDVYAGATQMDMIEGERRAYDFVGKIDLTQKTTRFGDIPIDEIDHNRRWLFPQWFEKGVYVDDLDKMMLLTDPTSNYMKEIKNGVVRKKNDVIYAAFEATVQGGKDYGDDTYAFNDAVFSSASGGGRTIVHDATNAFAVGGTSSGLTIEKLILAREALSDLHNDPNQIFNLVCSQRQISQLFREAETQSIDTSPFRALADGKMMPFHGFRFMVDYNVKLGSSNDIDLNTDIYPCYAFTSDAILYAQHTTPIFNVDWIPRKQIWQLSCRCGMNAIRMDEDKVIKIECIA